MSCLVSCLYFGQLLELHCSDTQKFRWNNIVQSNCPLKLLISLVYSWVSPIGEVISHKDQFYNSCIDYCWECASYTLLLEIKKGFN